VRSSQVARLRRRRLRVVVPHVEVLHRGVDQLLRIHAVQAVHAHRELAVALRERAHAAASAEAVMQRLPAELVVAQRLLAGKQAEVAGGHRREPRPGLEADRAVALERALREVEVGLEAHRAAMTASLIGLFHPGFFGPAITIQFRPKRSATMPKLLAKKVSLSGRFTWPPSASALKRRLASASSLALKVREKPWKLGLPLQLPSDAITWVSPTRKQECITFSPALGGLYFGSGFSL